MMKTKDIRDTLEMCKHIVPVLTKSEWEQLLLILYSATNRILRDSEKEDLI